MQTEGTGLGLFITYSIVQKHHGRVWFESHEGQGTTFFVSLPLVGHRSQLAGKPEALDQMLQKY